MVWKWTALFFCRTIVLKAKKEGERMNIIHIMADGSTRESIDGVVIQSEQFYRVLQNIVEKQKEGAA